LRDFRCRRSFRPPDGRVDVRHRQRGVGRAHGRWHRFPLVSNLVPRSAGWECLVGARLVQLLLVVLQDQADASGLLHAAAESAR
jgi:hypothetical protein